MQLKVQELNKIKFENSEIFRMEKKKTIFSHNNILSTWDLLKEEATENLYLGFLNFMYALMKVLLGWWCHVWTIERSYVACTIWIFKLLKQCHILFRAMKLWQKLKKTKLPMLAKDSIKKKTPKDAFSWGIEHENWRSLLDSKDLQACKRIMESFFIVFER